MLASGGLRFRMDSARHPHEARFLGLDCSKAAARLAWRPCVDVDRAMAWTVAWYDAFSTGRDMRVFTVDQIREYHAATVSASATAEESGSPQAQVHG
jgi:CDP-glucose 4,6-dehydratase